MQICIDGKNHALTELHDTVFAIRLLLGGAYEAFEVEENAPDWDPLRCAIRHHYIKSAFLPHLPRHEDEGDHEVPARVISREERALYSFLTSIVFHHRSGGLFNHPVIPETREEWLGGLQLALDYIRTYENRSIQLILLNMKAYIRQLLDKAARWEDMKEDLDDEDVGPSQEDMESVVLWEVLSQACGRTPVHDDNTRRFTELWEMMMVHNFHVEKLNPLNVDRSETLIHRQMPLLQVAEMVDLMENFTKACPEIAGRINQYRSVALYKDPMVERENIRQLQVKYEQLKADHDRLKVEVDRKEDHHPKLRGRMDPDPHDDDKAFTDAYSKITMDPEKEEMERVKAIAQETVGEDIRRARGLSIETGVDRKFGNHEEPT